MICPGDSVTCTEHSGIQLWRHPWRNGSVVGREIAILEFNGSALVVAVELDVVDHASWRDWALLLTENGQIGWSFQFKRLHRTDT